MIPRQCLQPAVNPIAPLGLTSLAWTDCVGKIAGLDGGGFIGKCEWDLCLFWVVVFRKLDKDFGSHLIRVLLLSWSFQASCSLSSSVIVENCQLAIYGNLLGCTIVNLKENNFSPCKNTHNEKRDENNTTSSKNGSKNNLRQDENVSLSQKDRMCEAYHQREDFWRLLPDLLSPH